MQFILHPLWCLSSASSITDYFDYAIHTLNIAQTHFSMRQHIGLKEGAVVC